MSKFKFKKVIALLLSFLMICTCMSPMTTAVSAISKQATESVEKYEEIGAEIQESSELTPDEQVTVDLPMKMITFSGGTGTQSDPYIIKTA